MGLRSIVSKPLGLKKMNSASKNLPGSIRILSGDDFFVLKKNSFFLVLLPLFTPTAMQMTLKSSQVTLGRPWINLGSTLDDPWMKLG